MPRNPVVAVPATLDDPAKVEPRTARKPNPSMGLAVADLGIFSLFLGLTFLLGIFPQHDTDYWWHLRTGDLIRAEGKVPHTDWYTFGASDHTWIDLHWGFQLALSFLYSTGGVNATILGKCLVTTLAVAMLITARRRDWPLWVMVLSWLPALIVLGGRMYVRPETLTLLYIAIDLAVLSRIDRFPRLAWVLPIVQVFWVNSQGLFAFGPIFIGMALIDASLRRSAFSASRRGWWRTVLSASLATGFACLLNPYGLMGAIYPLTLLGTMGNPVFQDIGELQSINEFIKKSGFGSLMLQLHLLTMLLGGLSFLIPVLWTIQDRLSRPVIAESPTKSKKKKKPSQPEEPIWRLSPFRLMLYVVFSWLSLKATRNSHQFAAVVGTITAWNFGEWAAAIARRRIERTPRHDPSAAPLIPRVATGVLLAFVILCVGSGQLYAWMGEDRTVGWGERSNWFAHDAVKFAGSKGMPARFLTYHNGIAGLFEYHNGPRQKVYTDARLEVIGPELYTRDKAIRSAIATEQPNWTQRIERLGPPTPGVVLDHVQLGSPSLGAAFLGNSEWRCVWHDPTASVYLHQSAESKAKAVDFAARHFGIDVTSEPNGAAALALSNRALTEQARPLILNGTNLKVGQAMAALAGGYGRKALSLDPSLFRMWRFLGVIQSLSIKGTSQEAEPRFRLPFDPITDIPYLRATHDFEQAIRLAPEDFESLTYLLILYSSRGMEQAANVVGDRLVSMNLSPVQTGYLKELAPRIARAQVAVSRPAKTSWSNAAQLDRVLKTLYDDGRVETAADLLTSAYKPAERTWDQTDLIATMRLHLGRPDLARAVYLEAVQVPRPALRDARVALTYLAQGDFDAAKRLYQTSIAAEPDLFEAHYGLAVLERDRGNAKDALKAAKAAEKAAGSDAARNAASLIAEFVRPYTKPREDN